MLTATATFRVPAHNLEAARPHMAAMIAASRAEAGCLHYGYGENVLNSGLIHVTEHWADHATLEAHHRADHIGAWRAARPALGIGERDLTLFETSEERGI